MAWFPPRRPRSAALARRTACWLCAILAFGLLSPVAWSQQAEKPSLDRLTELLRQRTEARRAAAALAWKESGEAYLAKPSEERRDALLAYAPELQGPVLQALRHELAQPEPDGSRADALVALLGRASNAAGADRLAGMLGSLPAAAQLRAISIVGARGGARSERALEACLDAEAGDLREAALLALLRSGDPEHCREWLGQVRLDRLSQAKRGELLAALTERPLPAGFQLPKSWVSLDEPRQAEALFAFWTEHPDETIEEPLLAFVLDRNRPLKLRLAGLAVAEHGAEAFRWRDTKRRLAALLRADEGDPLAESAAWAVHRLGDKAGARYLLDEPEERVKRNKGDWRAHLELGEMQVRLAEFRDGFRSYEDAIQLAEVARGRLAPEDWLYAARAAAGSRKEREAGEWLARTRMSPSELAPYRELPEFADLLDQEPFDRLFGRP